ncbi:MAG: recombinase family protein [Clostridiaceae bacterium]|nr:recombinase family protein [Clostridiaceae bacterium]
MPLDAGGRSEPDQLAQSMRAGLYLRLSREDGEGESQSIASQRLLLTNYCAQQGIPIGGEYVDDGYSGTNFQRPAFLRLLADIEAGLIDVVITKDLSRLGRDYIMTGHYLERYFPEKGVRYIALGDNIDTLRGQDDMTPFRAVVNDLYARDISRKVRASLDAKKRAGQFIGARPPYGYRRSPEDRGRLEEEPEKARQVRQIFRMAAEGLSPGQIARRMDAAGTPPPSGKAVCWSGAMVRRILTCPTYRGDLTQNRSRKISYKVEKSLPLPPEQWTVAPGACPPLVTLEQFQAAQQGLKPARRSKNPLSGLVFCGLCGGRMTFASDGSRRYLLCGGRRRKNGCQNPAWREEQVRQAILQQLAQDLSQADPAQTAACLEKYVGQSIGVEACRQTLAELEKAPERLLPLLPAVLERVRLSPGLMEIDWRRKGRNGQDSALKKRG